jgi:hypothetical protein
MKTNRKTLKIRWGLSSNTMIQETDNVLSSVYSYSDPDLNTNKVINQKYFYSDSGIDIANDNNSLKIYKYRTVKKVQIGKEEKEKLKKYLKEQKVSIKYFEKFEGYISLVSSEGLQENIGYFIKNISICFINSLLKEKKIVINIEKEEDIDILILLFKNYLDDFVIIDSTKNQWYLYHNITRYKVFKKDLYFFKIQLCKNLKEWIEYLKKYKSLINYIKNLELIELKKNYIYMETKQNLDKKKLNDYFSYNDMLYGLYKFHEKKILNFKGYIFLVEIEIIISNQKIKRFSLFFYNIDDNKWHYSDLLDNIRVKFVLDILKEILIEKDNKIDNFLLNELMIDIKNVNISFENDYVFEKFDNVSFNKDNTNIIKINDYKSLIFYLEHYQLFFFLD